jgi:hypothetical protein
MEASDYWLLHGNGATFAGQVIDSSCVLVKYTYYGDANFDGKANFDDYVRLDVGFNTGLNHWSNGDFNYSGTINFDDYVLIDIAFNTQSGTLNRRDGSGTRLTLSDLTQPVKPLSFTTFT